MAEGPPVAFLARVGCVLLIAYLLTGGSSFVQVEAVRPSFNTAFHIAFYFQDGPVGAPMKRRSTSPCNGEKD